MFLKTKQAPKNSVSCTNSELSADKNVGMTPTGEVVMCEKWAAQGFETVPVRMSTVNKNLQGKLFNWTCVLLTTSKDQTRSETLKDQDQTT